MFSMRIVSTDHYLAEPIPEMDMVYSEFRSSKIYKVPVIRLYGPTKSGQKTCMHIHGVFPYLYVPYDGSQPLSQYVQQFAISVDHAVNIALGNASSSRQHVYKISVVSGIPFYGFHSEEQSFLKIYLYSARLVQKVADLLLGGAIMNRVFQPHETHIPYTLQMFIDYNLFGMNFIDVGAVKFRYPLPGAVADTTTSLTSSDQNLPIWTLSSVTKDMLLNSDVKRLSSCELEVDVVAADIINRLQIEDNLGRNPGLCALWEDERRRRADRRLPPDLEPPGSQDRNYTGTAAEDAMLSRLHQILVSLQPYTTSQTSGSNTLFGSFPASNESQEATVHSEQSFGSSINALRPVVDEESVRMIFSASQQSRENQSLAASQLLSSSQDQSLVLLLASLAAEVSPSVVATLEDNDSVISQILPSSAEVLNDIEIESLEMSQRVWNTPEAESHNVVAGLEVNPPIWDELDNPVAVDSEEQPFVDLQGMDQSWNSSQWVSLRETVDSSGDENGCVDLPQLDGLVDVKGSDGGGRVTKRRYGRLLPRQAVGVKDKVQISSSVRPESANTLPAVVDNNPTSLETSLNNLVSGLRNCRNSGKRSSSADSADTNVTRNVLDVHRSPTRSGLGSRNKIERCEGSCVVRRADSSKRARCEGSGEQAKRDSSRKHTSCEDSSKQATHEGSSKNTRRADFSKQARIDASSKRSVKCAKKSSTLPRKSSENRRSTKRTKIDASFTDKDMTYMSSCFISLERMNLKQYSETNLVFEGAGHQERYALSTSAKQAHEPSLLTKNCRKERSKLSLSKCKTDRTTQSSDVLNTPVFRKSEKCSEGLSLYNEAMETSEPPSGVLVSAVNHQLSLPCEKNLFTHTNSIINSQNDSADIEHNAVCVDDTSSAHCVQRRGKSISRLKLKLAKGVSNKVSARVSEQRNYPSGVTICGKQVPIDVKLVSSLVDSVCSEQVKPACETSYVSGGNNDQIHQDSYSTISVGDERLTSIFCREVENLDCTDVMYHMALMSSPEPSEFDSSPPLPSSPSNLECVNSLGFHHLADYPNINSEASVQVRTENPGGSKLGSECQNKMSTCLVISEDSVPVEMPTDNSSQNEHHIVCLNNETQDINVDIVRTRMETDDERQFKQHTVSPNSEYNIPEETACARMHTGTGSQGNQCYDIQNKGTLSFIKDIVHVKLQTNDESPDNLYNCRQNIETPNAEFAVLTKEQTNERCRDDSIDGDLFSNGTVSVKCETLPKDCSVVNEAPINDVFDYSSRDLGKNVSIRVPDCNECRSEVMAASLSLTAKSDDSLSFSVESHEANEEVVLNAGTLEEFSLNSRALPLEDEVQNTVAGVDFVVGEDRASDTTRLVWRPLHCPPSHCSVLMDLASRQHLVQSTLDAFCSNPLDLPAIQRDGCEANIAIRSPLITDLPEHISSTSHDCSIANWQSMALSHNRVVGSSQSQFDARNMVSCPALLASSLQSDPTIVLVPLVGPPEPRIVREWVRKIHGPDYIPPLPEEQRDNLKHITVSIKSQVDAVTNGSISCLRGKPATTLLNAFCSGEKQAAKSQSTLFSDAVFSSLESEESQVGGKNFNLCDKSIPVVLSNIKTCGAAVCALSITPQALSGEEELLTSSCASVKDIAWCDATECEKPHSSFELSTSLVVQPAEEACVPTGVMKRGVLCTESASVSLPLSGNVVGSGSESTTLTSQHSFGRTDISKASRVELELPQTYNTVQNTADKFIKEQEDSVNIESASHLSFRGAECDVPMASTPYSRLRNSSNFEQKLVESPIDCVQNTPRRSSVEVESRQHHRPKCAIKLTTKQDVPSALTAGKNVVKHPTREETSQICGPTPKNPFGFKLPSQNIEQAKAVHEYQYITVLSIELFSATRSDLLPDPEFDEIRAVFYAIHTDTPPSSAHHTNSAPYSAMPHDISGSSHCGRATADGVIMVMVSNDGEFLHKTGLSDCNVVYVESELKLIAEVVDLVKRCDADMLVGYEIQHASWGYLVQRAARFDLNLQSLLSRVTDGAKEYQSDRNDKDDGEDISDLRIVGRVVLNLWRVIRHEVTLNIYTFENVAYHVLHVRLPWYSERDLRVWFDHKTHLYRWRTVQYYALRARANLQLIEKLDLIGQTSEFARVFGIEFYHVLSRGSQYRVESMMLRLAKPLNFVAVSPSVQQRARMLSPECIPLNLEPLSQFYTHPVVVLDFQSLYPSIMIAYNYCYSTCLGRLDHLARANEGAFDFGCTSLNISPDLLKSLKNDVNICPNGVVFVKHHIRHGILPRMVEEILNSRLMVKKAMKDYKNEPGLHRLLNARQLGLKLIANVTFGYTSANFSGRMPCVEIGDSIVRKSRETLERAIHLVENTHRWGAKVVYGDTDSMFVLLQGRTKEEAFTIGQQIADAVTMDNPKPVKLKLEKVYLPCVLQTKKRYVGFMYESPDQKEPVYDAKGIETVRRDSCAAVSKVLERSIKLLFTTRDVSQIKLYVQRQCTKMMTGTACIQDFIFAKEYRGASGYQPGACVPALEIARRSVAKDRRSEPLAGQRVPYVIVYGMPGLPLIQLVRSPRELLADSNLRLNVTYYITKQILPPLGRVFSLLGVDVNAWYNDLPRVLRSTGIGELADGPSDGAKKKGTLLGYFSSLNCPVCDERSLCGLCSDCKTDKQRVAVISCQRIHSAEQRRAQIDQICTSCMGYADPSQPCASLDCPIFFRLFRVNQELNVVRQLEKLQLQLLNC